MCTVSWIHEQDGFHLLCNRDEKRARQLALAPTAQSIDGVHVLAPKDAQGGGTWVAVNEYGVAVTLLNGANIGGADTAGAFVCSRGLVLLHLATARTAYEVCERAWRLDLNNVAPFTVAALEPDMPAALVEWNGAEKAILLSGNSFLPLVSSSYDAAGAQAVRQQEFTRICGAAPNSARLLAYHQSHLGEGGSAYSPCMHRDDAETVSFSWVHVSRTSASFHYQPEAPCRHSPSFLTSLALRT